MLEHSCLRAILLRYMHLSKLLNLSKKIGVSFHLLLYQETPLLPWDIERPTMSNFQKLY